MTESLSRQLAYLPEGLARFCLFRAEEATSGCWLWQGATDRGYGKANLGGRNYRVHRLVYEQIVGSISSDLQLDHLCRVKHCVNPAHLEPVSPRENTQRAYRGQTTCVRGHLRSEENTWRAKNGRMECLPCRRLRRRVEWLRHEGGARPTSHEEAA